MLLLFDKTRVHPPQNMASRCFVCRDARRPGDVRKALINGDVFEGIGDEKLEEAVKGDDSRLMESS